MQVAKRQKIDTHYINTDSDIDIFTLEHLKMTALLEETLEERLEHFYVNEITREHFTRAIIFLRPFEPGFKDAFLQAGYSSRDLWLFLKLKTERLARFGGQITFLPSFYRVQGSRELERISEEVS